MIRGKLCMGAMVVASGLLFQNPVAAAEVGVTDNEIETILERAHEAGARDAGYVMLRLPLEVQDIFGDWLLENAPDKYRRVMNLMRSMREGKVYDAAWGKRMTGTGPYAGITGRRFEAAVRRFGFNENRTRLRTDLFTRPVRPGGQMSLF